jgi:hypothetical protein
LNLKKSVTLDYIDILMRLQAFQSARYFCT